MDSQKTIEPSRIDFLGCPVDALNMSTLVQTVEAWIVQGSPHRIAVINANKLWLMRHDERLRMMVHQSDLIIPEWAVVWGASKLGFDSLHFLPGIGVLRRLLAFAEIMGISVYFLGATEPTLMKMIGELHFSNPALRIAGFHHGYLNDKAVDASVREDIQETKPDLLYVGMGSPRQEYWIADHQQELNVPVIMGVGGSFDVLAGIKRDTPSWARGKGVEWLYRLWQDPKAYWKRYLITNAWFVYRVAIAKLRSTLHGN